MDKGLYSIVAFCSSIYRTYFAMNPFDAFFVDDSFFLGSAYLTGFVFNWVVTPLILHLPTYCLVGCVYKKGSCPVIGSLLYVGCYVVQLNILNFICKYACSVASISLDLLVGIIVVYIIVAVIEISVLSGIRNLSRPRFI